MSLPREKGEDELPLLEQLKEGDAARLACTPFELIRKMDFQMFSLCGWKLRQRWWEAESLLKEKERTEKLTNDTFCNG